MIRSIAVLALTLLAPWPTAALSPEPAWQWPADTPRVVMRPFIAPPSPYASGHRGIDVVAEGGRVFAPVAGTVHFAGTVVDRPVMSIRHAGGLISSFEPVETTLRQGDAVARGDPIGTVLPGHCSGTCLHFGVRLDGEYVSPLLYLGGISPSVLLPTRR